MTARFFPPMFRLFFYTVSLAVLWNVSSIFADDIEGPVFPEEFLEDTESAEPPPLPKKNPLLQRPRTKQLVFDDLDPVGSIVPQSFLNEEELIAQPAPALQQRKPPKTIDTAPDISNETIFTPEGAMIQGTVHPTMDYADGEIINEYSADMSGFLTGPIVQTFGMSIFDNLTLSAEATTYKTPFNNGSGSLGIGEGINWSTPITPQGTITAQYGVHAIQGDNFSRAARSQCFTTAGLFKRFDFASIQGGVAVDWLHDHSQFGSVDVKQMRAELSARSFNGLEYGFIGGFDVFQDRPSTPKIDQWVYDRYGVPNGALFVENFGAVDVQDYYLLFVRKHLNSGGQAEFRCGATEWGDIILSVLGEAAINDRLAVNGGLTIVAPSEGKSIQGNERESWSLSLGIVLYFRGGAISRQSNLYRPMFDVAGNNSLFTRMRAR